MLPFRPHFVALCLGVALLAPAASTAQDQPPTIRAGDADVYDDHVADRGTTGLLTALQRLGSVASLLHVTAHPDDEHSGMLTRMARGHGVRTSLLSLNRGEGGANAIGPELFDALGVIRTEELLLSGRWYGLSALYFTTAVDYGYSKTLEEALTSWSRERLLEDMVRVIRKERPIVVVSRWYGAAERDGHGHHQAAGVLSPEAVEAAADPTRFPEQLSVEGLRPWRALRLYRGGVRADEAPDVSLETTVYSPLLGRSFQDFASEGLSLQRSQTAGRVRRPVGESWYHYERLSHEISPSAVRASDAASAEIPFFNGLDTSLEAVFSLTGEDAPGAAEEALAAAAAAIERARAGLDPRAPSGILPDLVAALNALRQARTAAAGAPDARFILGREIDETTEAIRLAAGIMLRATARDSDGQPVHRVASGQRIEIEVAASAASGEAVRLTEVEFESPVGWMVDAPAAGRLSDVTRASVRVGSLPGPPGPYFGRSDVRESVYTVSDSAFIHAPWRASALRAVATFDVAGTWISWTAPVRGEELDLPRGVPLRLLQVVPAASVGIQPSVRVVPHDRVGDPLDFRVTVSRLAGPVSGGRVRLAVPSGWRVEPEGRVVGELSPGETTDLDFRVWTPNAGPNDTEGDGATIRAVLETESGTFDRTERRIAHPDLEPRSLFTPAEATVQRVSLAVEPGRHVGYVMGVGDEIPAALRELGATVELLADQDLQADALSRYDLLVIGTRAYAVRPALAAANDDVLAFARSGGHVVVLYQTPEFDAAALAPWDAELPGNAEEVSEEDAPVRLLHAEHPLLQTPNRITTADFADWVEQRGSKFFTRWGPEFTPLVETHDTAQEPQRGVWLTAPLDGGHWTYIALALHRQTPYGVPGAYRILANLISYGAS